MATGRLHRRLALAALLALVACSNGTIKHQPDAATTPPTCASGVAPKANGAACACAIDCASGHCADGVCCNSACGKTCMSCNTPAAPGTCTFVASGVAPSDPATCPRSDATTCGLDGTCNGAGACRKHASGTVCRAGKCDGAAVGGVFVCDGAGRCAPGATTVCAPYDCDPTKTACFESCRSDDDCTDGTKCVAGSCGQKAQGAVCKKDADCESGFCADGVCCNVACKGACVSCNLVGRVGTCWPVEPGTPDPRKVCKDAGAPSCGQTGSCDGFGGCALYAAETICSPASCAGDRRNTPGTCDGIGKCRAPGVQNCEPFKCAAGACTTKCTTDDDCHAGHACVNGSCGLRPPGQVCASAAECASGFCVDGVCCADACAGGCRTCALPSSMGRCAPVPAGASDPRGSCADQGAASCGTDGVCDGAGACRKYKVGTPCQAETCAANLYTPPGTCDATGACAAPAALPCAPFACNGARCFSSCRGDTDCAAPNTCDGNNSCGKKGLGSFCSGADDCASGFCAQGVCCASACTGTCKSCALGPSMGTCADVPTGAPDPSGTCVAKDTTSCGTNGMCEAGACQRYALGTPCGDATCPAGGTTYTAGATCDGAGACVTPAAKSCFPFRCGDGACKATCTGDGDCAPPGVCAGGSCGLKPPGAVCADAGDCASGFCAQGACCKTACGGACRSCALATSEGTCASVPAGSPDPAGTCKNAGAGTCGTTGLCDGAGACDLYAAGTTCAQPTCPAGTSTATLARTCDGAGTCRPGTTQSCAPYACGGATCRAACGGDADCAAPSTCDLGTSTCGAGKKRLGQPCATGDECVVGASCTDGVCCATASCPTCQACNVPSLEGACAAVPGGGADPHARCAAAPPCGATGLCDGASACALAPATTSCGMASCAGSTFTAVGACSGTGTCLQTPGSCGAYVCGPADMCLTMCTGAGDCAAGMSCVGGSCTNLRGNGTACTLDGQCVSGHCTEGFCCGVAACPACNSCAVAGHEGVCSPTPGGTVCAAATCSGNSGMLKAASMCDGAGACVTGAMTSCSPWACAAAACKVAPCASDGDCSQNHSCDLGTGQCQ